MLLASRCPVCGAAGEAPCRTCAAGLRPAPALPVPQGLSACHALLAYEGTGRALLSRLKYRNARAALGRLAASMAALVDPGTIDVVTWAPTTPARRRARGFDQAELLARAVASSLGRPCLALLRRTTPAHQTGRPASERAAVSFTAAARARGARVLVVDDVATTGATLAAAARALSAAGAAELRALVAARTPLKPRRPPAETD